jgi:hypothetical protein
VDYLPLKDPDGNIVGMTFTGEADEIIHLAASRAVNAMVIVALLFVIIFAVVIILVANVVRRPLVELAEELEVFAGGGLSSDILVRSIITENQNMISSLKYMQYSLQNMVGEIQGEADSLNQDIHYVEKMSENSADSTNQITSAMNEIIFAVSLTVSPCAICDFPSSKSCTSSPNKLQAEAKENLVLVELSLNRDIPSPESNTFVEIFCSLNALKASATSHTALISSSVLSQVKKKSPLYIFLKSSLLSFDIASLKFVILIYSPFIIFYIL